MTMEEVQNSKRKLAIFDQYVIDFGMYLYDHPGGKYVLEECRGKEIGKYFYGAYSLDDNIKVHKHSFVAGKIMKKIAIAKLKLPMDIDNMVTFGGEGKGDGRDHSHELYNGHFKVTRKDEIFKGVYRVTFSNENNHYKIVLPGTSTFGRHYLIHSESQKVSRYYTICNSMNSEIYPVYINNIDRLIGNSRDEKLSLDNVDDITESLQLIIKFYEQSRKGLTRLLANVQDEDEFLVSKPMGKGLDLSADSITGTNLVFLGGTGVLPFLDFFVFLARMIISEKSPSDKIINNEEFEPFFKHSSFKVYAYYPNANEAVALDLLVKISDLFSHFKEEERFSFTPVFTRQGGDRLNDQKIYEFLDQASRASDLKNIWVCGPPKMNNMFQRLRKTIERKYEGSAVDIM